jgi:hypothetical protein
MIENSELGKKMIESRSKRSYLLKIAPEKPVLWTGMKGASPESRKNKSDAETSLIFISPRFSMTWRLGSALLSSRTRS